MIVVGYVYNTNGMATWCFEVANALHENGYNVLLVHSKSVKMPVNMTCRTLQFDLVKKNDEVFSRFRVIKGIQIAIRLLKVPSRNFLVELQRFLLQNDIKPDLYLLNQADFASSEIRVKQFVCAWVYPFNLKTYIRNGKRSFQDYNWSYNIRLLITSIGFYRKDRIGFSQASVTCALTPLMHSNLQAYGIKTRLLTPCIGQVKKNIDYRSNSQKNDGNIVISLAALNLEDPRKKIFWLLTALERLSDSLVIHLYGNYSSRIVSYANNSRHKVVLKGYLDRVSLLNEISNSDIFLYGSTVEDWGFVVTEAMSLGIPVLAPNRHPFDFILSNQQLLYEEDKQDDLINRINVLIADRSLLHSLRTKMSGRYLHLFSHSKFVQQFQSILNE